MTESQCSYSASGCVEILPLSNIKLLAPDKRPKVAPAKQNKRAAGKTKIDSQKPAGTAGVSTTPTVEQEPAQPAASVDAPEASRQAETVNFVPPPEDSH